MIDPLTQLANFHNLLGRKLHSTNELREAARLAHALALSDIDGAGAFLLFGLYFQNLAALRENAPADTEKYDRCIAELIRLIEECLEAIESYDATELHASLDSFARTALRFNLP
jgi:hypothetical protein